MHITSIALYFICCAGYFAAFTMHCAGSAITDIVNMLRLGEIAWIIACVLVRSFNSSLSSRVLVLYHIQTHALLFRGQVQLDGSFGSKEWL
jgi:hypothetical protein